jgi:alkanesulfonate monooxygenase SsuD/methylene tetrahydromethanopterin reductase-like flavin-dependent oxidoreductase (luciferase family)
MHEVRLLWANHVSHHSGERYNLSTALRQPWSGFLTFWVFAPMPLLGFPTAKTAKAGQLNLLYQYWIHTEAIDKLRAEYEQAQAAFQTLTGATVAEDRSKAEAEEIKEGKDDLGGTSGIRGMLPDW